jgi:hypothetical protein
MDKMAELEKVEFKEEQEKEKAKHEKQKEAEAEALAKLLVEKLKMKAEVTALTEEEAEIVTSLGCFIKYNVAL